MELLGLARFFWGWRDEFDPQALHLTNPRRLANQPTFRTIIIMSNLFIALIVDFHTLMSLETENGLGGSPRISTGSPWHTSY